MKRWVLFAVVVGPMLVGCSADPVAYKTEITVTPAKESGQYIVETRIFDLVNDSLLATPRLTVLEGEEAEISVGNEGKRTIVTALVEKMEGGTAVRTSVVLEEDGSPLWSGQQTVMLHR